MLTGSNKKEVTTFEGLPEGAIRYGRRCGNSTRMCDHAIQQLFNGNIVHVQDHHQNGRHREANQHLFRMIMNRLTAEHPIDSLVKFDKQKLIIELIDQ